MTSLTESKSYHTYQSYPTAHDYETMRVREQPARTIL